MAGNTECRRSDGTRRLAVASALALALFAVAAAPSLAGTVPLLAAAGDVACPPTHPSYNHGAGTENMCRQRATARLLYHQGYDAILPIGDLIEPAPTLRNFRGVYGSTWGRLKGITHPAIGNHEYAVPHARAYFNYFDGIGRDDGRAGPRGEGWYSYDLGDWHLIALNANCERAGVGCTGKSRQVRWLRRDLRAHPNRCVLAYWHEPYFSSGLHGYSKVPVSPEAEENTRPFWKALYKAGADVILNGHDHLYERFAPQTPYGRHAPRRGIVQFTVGTGGRSHFQFTHHEANSRRRIANTFGILRLRLGHGRYHWRFIDIDHRTLDHGSRSCSRSRVKPPKHH